MGEGCEHGMAHPLWCAHLVHPLAAMLRGHVPEARPGPHACGLRGPERLGLHGFLATAMKLGGSATCSRGCGMCPQG